MTQANIQTRIVFTGDIAFSHHFTNGWQKEELFSSEIKRFLFDADHVIANLECPLTEERIQSARAHNHAGSPKAGAYLKKYNICNWSLANNHIMDCGIAGLNDTLSNACKNNCNVFGAGMSLDEASRPLILGSTIKIGVLAVAKPWSFIIAGDKIPGAFTWDKRSVLQRRIGELRQKVNWIVLIVHGGDEYSDLALPYMREQYKDLLNLGVDVIVAHHPHVVQNYELSDGKAIFYSLGNFVFDTDNQRDFAHTDNGIILGIDFGEHTFSFDYLPVHINREFRVIEKGKTPEVFTAFNDDEYSRLWPLAAHYFYLDDLRNRKRLHDHMRNASSLWIFAHEVYGCRHKKERNVQIGRLKYIFGKHKKSELTDVASYLSKD